MPSERQSDPVTTLLDLMAMALQWEEEHGDTGESVIATSMTEEDMLAWLNWEHVNICSDGSTMGRHPRGRGAFPRILGRYVREQSVLKLEEAIHKMTAKAAEHMGIRDRGHIAVGQRADLVAFDPDEIIDLATPEEPFALSVGIKKVFVNSSLVHDNGRSTGVFPGMAITRE